MANVSNVVITKGPKMKGNYVAQINVLGTKFLRKMVHVKHAKSIQDQVTPIYNAYKMTVILNRF